MPASTASLDEYAWWQTGVVYQIYPRSFNDSDGDGVGDLPGVVQKMDYLADTLGVDAVWLSPFYPSPMKDFGYDVADYCDVDPLFGELDDFDRLVDAAHTRGLKVIVDYVPNHSSDQHPWFQEARRARQSPRRDWYVWRDPKPDGSPPNNWLAHFGGPAWTLDEATGQYYLHSFLPQQPDLNWRNADLREAMFDVLRFWLNRGVDGFRIDVAHSIMKDPALRDNPPNPDPGGDLHKPMGEYDTQLHVHDKDHEDVHEVYRSMRAVVDAYDPPRVLIGEMHIYDWSRWTRYYGEALDEMHMPFNFSLLKADWTAAGVRRTVDELEHALPEGAWPNFVLGNHDEDRLASRIGPAQARVAAMLLLTLRGTPTLYYGDELGMTDVPIPVGKEQDPWGLRVDPALSRDPARTPMPWTEGPTAGFSDAAPDALWLPLGLDTASAEAQCGEKGSMLALYRDLLALRRSSPALKAGSYRAVDAVPDGCFAYQRIFGDEHRLVALNFTDVPLEVPLPADAYALGLATRPGAARIEGSQLRLAPNGGAVLER